MSDQILKRYLGSKFPRVESITPAGQDRVNVIAYLTKLFDLKVAWPSGLRRWFKALVSLEAWVRIPPLPTFIVFREKTRLLPAVLGPVS